EVVLGELYRRPPRTAGSLRFTASGENRATAGGAAGFDPDGRAGRRARRRRKLCARARPCRSGCHRDPLQRDDSRLRPPECSERRSGRALGTAACVDPAEEALALKATSTDDAKGEER